jgi:hypothetical protein
MYHAPHDFMDDCAAVLSGVFSLPHPPTPTSSKARSAASPNRGRSLISQRTNGSQKSGFWIEARAKTRH